MGQGPEPNSGGGAYSTRCRGLGKRQKLGRAGKSFSWKLRGVLENTLPKAYIPDAAVEFGDGWTRERYLSSPKPYSLAPMMGERGGVRGRQENGQRASMLTALNTHQSKLQFALSFAHLEQGLEAAGFQLLNPD